MLFYKDGKWMMMVAYYKDGKSMMTSLIIIKIRFISFKKDEISRSHIKSDTNLHAESNTRLHHHSFYD